MQSQNKVKESTDSVRRCPACGYDMRGTKESLCPECGINRRQHFKLQRLSFLRRTYWFLIADMTCLIVTLIVASSLFRHSEGYFVVPVILGTMGFTFGVFVAGLGKGPPRGIRLQRVCIWMRGFTILLLPLALVLFAALIFREISEEMGGTLFLVSLLSPLISLPTALIWMGHGIRSLERGHRNYSIIGAIVPFVAPALLTSLGIAMLVLLLWFAAVFE